MHLSESAFDAIYYGTKRVEVRLFDQKRRAISPGDIIEFCCGERGAFSAEVVRVAVFDSFSALFAAYPAELLGGAEPSAMYAYYTPEEERKYGAAAIELRLL